MTTRFVPVLLSFALLACFACGDDDAPADAEQTAGSGGTTHSGSSGAGGTGAGGSAGSSTPTGHGTGGASGAGGGAAGSVSSAGAGGAGMAGTSAAAGTGGTAGAGGTAGTAGTTGTAGTAGAGFPDDLEGSCDTDADCELCTAPIGIDDECCPGCPVVTSKEICAQLAAAFASCGPSIQLCPITSCVAPGSPSCSAAGMCESGAGIEQ